MDERRVHELITDVLIHGLHQYDEGWSQHAPTTAESATEACIKRYQCEPLFHATVRSMAARLMDVMYQAEEPDERQTAYLTATELREQQAIVNACLRASLDNVKIPTVLTDALSAHYRLTPPK